jgi:serine/threonine protein kinase
LIFKLIPPHYKNLGGSPSFETCTRDTFAEGTVFSVHQIMSIISGIASAALHLHARALMHGDLYAHNILIDEQAHALFGDFGAATHYELDDEYAQAFERMEVRAFGCLLDDLLTHVDVKDSQPVRSLQQLRDDCMQPNVMMRPSFSAICNRLSQQAANKRVV